MLVSGVLLGAMSELSKMLWVWGEGGEDHPLLVVRTTEHLKKQVVQFDKYSDFSSPGCREDRTGLQHRTCVHTAGKQNTRDDKRSLVHASPSQRQGSPSSKSTLNKRLLKYFSLKHLSTSGTVARWAEESEVVALAQQKVPLRVQGLTNLRIPFYFYARFSGHIFCGSMDINSCWKLSTARSPTIVFVVMVPKRTWWPHLTKSAVATSTLETIFVPILINLWNRKTTILIDLCEKKL